MKSDLEDITVVLHHTTERAVLVSENGDRDDAVWLPLSQIEVRPVSNASGCVEITAPEWLLKDKGLI